MKTSIKICRWTLIVCMVIITFSCEEKPKPPTVTTTSVSEISYTTAKSGGEVTDEGGSPVISNGICWNTSADPTISNTKSTNGSGIGSFTSELAQLIPNTTYFIKAYATNSAGTGYGDQVTFKTLKVETATLTTTEVTSITQTTAISGGNITSENGAKVTVRGICWSTEPNPTTSVNTKTIDNADVGSFQAKIIGLIPNTTYYIKAYATNSIGTSYGNEIQFKTIDFGTLQDIEGNSYKTVIIGDQTWMAENLKTTKFNDNSNIPNVTDYNAWSSLTTPGYCWYNNDEITYKVPYGGLYNWFAVNSNKLCPSGWHVPSDSEWTSLTDYLGGVDVAGGKLKETGTTNWKEPNAGATNESGFTALPGGICAGGGAFYNVHGYSAYWSSTAYSTNYAWFRYIYYHYSNVNREYTERRVGLSVRCIKD